MGSFLRPISPTAEDFEREVQRVLERSGMGLRSFTATHRERISGSDGDYQIDVSARFEALGAHFLVLVECKHQKRPVEREVVQILADRVRSVGAQKGMLFTTSSFQSGAIEYARTHGIALIVLADGTSLFMTRSADLAEKQPLWPGLPPMVAVLVQGESDGRESYTNLDGLPEALADALRFDTPKSSQ